MSGARVLIVAVTMTASVLPALPVCSQDYPVRPVRMVYVFSGGGASDVMARVAAQKLGEQLGQQVLVENKPGAGGLIGTRDVLQSRPLGYSILFSTAGLIGNLHAYRNPQYKLEDFTPIGVLGEIPFAMIIHNSVPARTLAEFIAHARANPGKLNYGSIGPSAGGTILAERLKQSAGIDLTMIPFKGGEPASLALFAGDIHVYYATLGVARQRLKNPNILGLAVTAERRSQIFPDLPTFKELGQPSQLLGTWHAMFAPAATTGPVLQKLQTAMRAVMSSAEMKAALEKNEEDPWTGTLEDFVAKMKVEYAATGDDYRRLKLPVQD